jgi:hypothetical protein
MAMLAVPREQKLYVLMAAQNAYSEIPMAAATAAATAAAGAVPAEAAGDVKVVRTRRRETIAGYACEHVQVTAAAQTTDVCLSTALGRYVNPLESMRGTAAPAWQRAVGGEGFPLKVTLPDGTVASRSGSPTTSFRCHCPTPASSCRAAAELGVHRGGGRTR